MVMAHPSSQTALIQTHHADLLSSLSLSHHGNLLATSSLDHSIRIFSLSPASLSWEPYGDPILKAHDAPVLRLAWAHPEFGVLLASAGVDGVVNLWVQSTGTNTSSYHSSTSTGGSGGNGSAGVGGAKSQASGIKWIQRASLTDCRGTVRDLEFAPSELGLKLAAVSSDSHLRIWECLDPVALLEWSLVEDIDMSALPSGTSSSAALASGVSGVGSLSGGVSGASGAGSVGLGVSGSTGNGGTISSGGTTTTKGFDTSSNSSFSPTKLSAFPPGNPGSSGFGAVGSFGAAASAGSSLGTTASSGGSAFDSRKSGTVESDGGWALSWCKEAWWGERLAVCSGSTGVIRLFHLPPHNPWTNFLNLSPPRLGPSSSPISSLSWAPSSGRSFQLLASGSRDGRARVWKIHTPGLEDEEGKEEEDWKGEMDSELEVEPSAQGRGGGVASVKVEWNLTGTVLSTAGDDAIVRLWKSTYTGQWKVIAALRTDDDETDGGMLVDK